jgi:hypothetical protein
MINLSLLNATDREFLSSTKTEYQVTTTQKATNMTELMKIVMLTKRNPFLNDHIQEYSNTQYAVVLVTTHCI